MDRDGLLTVESLIDILRQFNPERVVIIAKDPEGNEYSPLSEVTTAAYVPETSWYGVIGLEELTEDFEGLGYTVEDVVDGIPCIILDPIN